MVGRGVVVFSGTINTTSTNLGEVAGVEGAEYVLLSFRGGSNVTNALATLQAVPLREASGLNGNGLQLTVTGLPRTDGAANAGNWAIAFLQNAAGDHMIIPFPVIRLFASMTTALSNTVIVEAFPVFAERRGTQKTTLTAEA